MSLTTLSSAKEYMWITDTTQDSLITTLIESFSAFIQKDIWVIEEQQVEEDIILCNIKCWKIYLCNSKIVSIDEINWTTYTWVLNTDYKVTSSKVVINDINLYLTDLKFDSVTIKYTAWYNPVPADVELAVNRMIAWELNKQAWEPLKSYKMGPRSYTFAWEWDLTADQVYNSSISILSKYKTFIC